MTRKQVLLLALAAMAIGVGVVGLLSPDENDVTDKFSKLETGRFSVNKLLGADTVCIVPHGIDPYTYATHQFVGRPLDHFELYDSAYSWYVISADDAGGDIKVLRVDLNQVQDKFQIECSRNLVVRITQNEKRREISLAE